METQFVKIPKDRVAVLIGAKGEAKKKLEELTRTKIFVNSGTGEVGLDAGKNGDDYLQLKAAGIVKAIGRGFSPENALHLLADDVYLDVIDLPELVGKSEKDVARVKSRVIGKNGSARSIIENETGAMLSVYGKTVALIGSAEGIETAREAITMLAEGSMHSTVYGFLKRKIKIQKGFEV